MRVLVLDLIAVELDQLDAAEREQACSWVLARLDGAGDLSRIGFRLAATMLRIAARLRTQHAYEALSDARRRRVAAEFAATQAPLVGEFVRVIRALAVSYAYEEPAVART